MTLSDYGRFKGSRKANVEVHGGASLEEVIVPIITLTLRNNSSVEIRVLDKDEIHPDRHLGTTVKLSPSKNPLKNLNPSAKYAIIELKEEGNKNAVQLF